MPVWKWLKEYYVYYDNIQNNSINHIKYMV